MINPIEYLTVKIRLFLAARRTAAAKRAMEHSIQHTRSATEDIDQSYTRFLDKARQQEVLAVKLRQLQKKQSPYPILDVRVDTGSVNMTGPAEQALTKLDVELALTRHRHGDWGMVTPYQWRVNNRSALTAAGPIQSLYNCFGNKRFLVMTDRDRQTTQIRMEGEKWK